MTSPYNTPSLNLRGGFECQSQTKRITGSTCGFTPLENIQLPNEKVYTPIEAKLRTGDIEGLSNGVNWSSGIGCSPPVGVSWEPPSLPVWVHDKGLIIEKHIG